MGGGYCSGTRVVGQVQHRQSDGLGTDVTVLCCLLTGEALDELIRLALDPEAAQAAEAGQAPGLVDQVQSTMKSLQRFMRSLTN